MKRARSRGNSTRCPHCGARCWTVRTLQVSPMVREITFLCANEACGFQFVAQVTPLRVITPSNLTASPDATTIPATAVNDNRSS